MFNSDRKIFCRSYIQSLVRTGIQAISLPQDLVHNLPKQRLAQDSYQQAQLGKSI